MRACATAAAIAALFACATPPRHAPAVASGEALAERVPDRALVAEGRALAAIGNCATCHTADRGKSFAGGRPLDTPFGTLYATNITPDPRTGIGRWSREDFRRAMQQGTSPQGTPYYPVFPYDHFARAQTHDIDAIYAYLTTREPVHAIAPPNRLRFPYNVRALLFVWKSLYFHPQPIVADPARSADWNRGRYLVEGLAHCGACHTPRNALGAERHDLDLAGGEAEGWHAPALDASSPAPLPWTVDALFDYLRSGYSERHGASRGPMAPVTRALATVAPGEARAIAVYVASRIGHDASRMAPAATSAPTEAPFIVSDEEREAGGTESGADGGMAAVFETACAGCHGGRRALRLERSTAVADVTSANLVRVIYDGLAPVEGAPSRAMPGFRGALTEAQAVALVRYVRARFSGKPPWPDVEREVAQVANRGEGRTR